MCSYRLSRASSVGNCTMSHRRVLIIVYNAIFPFLFPNFVINVFRRFRRQVFPLWQGPDGVWVPLREQSAVSSNSSCSSELIIHILSLVDILVFGAWFPFLNPLSSNTSCKHLLRGGCGCWHGGKGNSGCINLLGGCGCSSRELYSSSFWEVYSARELYASSSRSIWELASWHKLVVPLNHVPSLGCLCYLNNSMGCTS
jgi:hypothetical protein